jgi:hypothetical protein
MQCLVTATVLVAQITNFIIDHHFLMVGTRHFGFGETMTTLGFAKYTKGL